VSTSEREYPAVAIAGPTASGKSDLGLYLAERLEGEIVNYDSIQLYRHLDIGSAKPAPPDRDRVRHHLIDVLEPADVASAGDYQVRGRQVMARIRDRGRIPFLVGGTGLYLRALLEGLFEGPRRSEDLRSALARLSELRGREHLHVVLSRVDPEAAGRILPRDTPKVIRALEVRFRTGRPLSAHFEERPRNPLPGFRVVLVGLDPPREALNERIARRVRGMFEAGLVEEVRDLLGKGVPGAAQAFRAIGYRQVVDHIVHGISLEDAIMSTERETRRYAKRQLTWFRRQHAVIWFDGFGDEERNQERIHRFVKNFLGGFPDGN
jgi:tRNA dimethylallyltransferase